MVVAPTLLGERGETAVFQDPEGTPFGVVRSKNGDPADYLGDLNEWLWVDLWTADVDRATKFYSAVAGYDVLPLEMEGPRSGAHLVSGGYVRAGVMRKNDERTTAVWLPYVRVADAAAAAATARAAGGKVLREPVSLRRAIVAVLADPTGAPVGVVQLLDKETQREHVLGHEGGARVTRLRVTRRTARADRLRQRRLRWRRRFDERRRGLRLRWLLRPYYGGGYYAPYPPVVVVPPGERPDRPDSGNRPTTLPSDVGGPSTKPSARPSTAPSRPSSASRPTSRPAPRPAPRPMPRGRR